MTTDSQPGSPYVRQAIARFEALLGDFVGVLGNLAAIAAIDVQGCGRRFFATGHADLAKTEPARPDHLFQIGSQSKTLVAMALLRLHRAGRLDLDEPVAERLGLPIDRRITARHLAMNQSGLGESTFATPADRRDPRLAIAPRDLVALALPQGQLFEPGSQFDYCNTGWTVAAMLIELLCGKPYGEVVCETVLAPLGLNDTVLGGVVPVERMLHAYAGIGPAPGLIDTCECLGWAYGAGDGVSSLADMLGLYASLAAPRNAVGVSLTDLNGCTGRPSANPYFPLSAGTEYGLGVERRAWAGAEVWGHPGSTFTYMSGTWIDVGAGVAVSTCVTRAVPWPRPPGLEARYPREQLFAMALSTAYAIAAERGP
jgi:D-alanyl-D-alanine carboxypeptidase